MTAIPKPRSYDRKKSVIDTRGLVHAKKHFARDAGKRAFVRRYRCALLGEGFGDCPTRQVECAHVETGGLGIKCSDDLTAPLCSAPGTSNCHHALYDQHKLPKLARVLVAKKGREIHEAWIEQKEKREKGR